MVAEKLEGFLKANRIHFQKHVSLKPYVTMKIAGRASILAMTRSSAELMTLIRFLLSARIPYVVIGGGSNVAFAGKTTSALVVVNRSLSPVILEGGRIKVESGLANSRFLNWCQKQGIGGFEFLAGIPGTMGGAVAVNAGAFGNSIGDRLFWAEILDSRGRIRIVGRDYFKFSYRSSRCRLGKEVILSVWLDYDQVTPDDITKKIWTNLKHRRRHHPSYREFTAGCFFKNPLKAGARISAGKLIQECGLKGRSFGRLSVSALHANFLINRGQASFSELGRVENKIVNRVKGRLNLSLEREVIYILPSGEKY